MGSSTELKEENKKLKEKIEQDLQPKIDKLIKEKEEKIASEKKLLDDNSKLKNTLRKQRSASIKNQIDLTPQQIQEMMVENSTMKEEMASLKTQVSNLKIENNEYKNYCTNLYAENNQLKLSCGQYQLMLQTTNVNQNMNMNNNNINSWRNQINDLININSFNNHPKTFNNGLNNNNFNNSFNNNNLNLNFNNSFNNNMNKNNFNNNFNNNNIMNNNDPNDKKVKTILFKFENGIKCPMVTFNNCYLRELYSLVLIQIGNNDFSDMNKLKFYYCARDITDYFVANKQVKSLGLPMSSVIDVVRLQNINHI